MKKKYYYIFLRFLFFYSPYFLGKYRLLTYLFDFNQQNLKVPDYSFTVKLDHNKYKGNLNNWIDSGIFFLGGWELGLKNLFFEIIKKNKDLNYYFDIGANSGTLTVPFMNKNIQIFSFEPLQYSFNKLKSNVELNYNGNNNVKLFKVALGNKKSKSKIYFSNSLGNIGTASVINNISSQYNSVEKVKMDKLDNIISLSKKKILIKIDVEGYEEEVIKGAKNLLSKNDCIIYIETNSDKLINDLKNKYEILYPNFKTGKKKYRFSLSRKEQDVILFNKSINI